MDVLVKNLSIEVSEEDLLDLFEEFGPVDSLCLGERESRGCRELFAVLGMPNPAQGQAAILALNGRKFKDLPLSVRENDPASVPGNPLSAARQ